MPATYCSSEQLWLPYRTANPALRSRAARSIQQVTLYFLNSEKGKALTKGEGRKLVALAGQIGRSITVYTVHIPYSYAMPFHMVNHFTDEGD
jgi:hypothetical protein